LTKLRRSKKKKIQIHLKLKKNTLKIS